MKKLAVLLCLTLLLTGCSKNNDVKVTDGDTLLWEGPDDSYTKQDLYEDMKAQNDYSSIISESVVMDIAEADGLDLTAEKEELGEQYDSYVSMLGDYASYYLGTKDQYIASSLYSTIVDKYITEDAENNFDSYVEEYAPYYGEIFYVDTKEASDAIVKAVNDGTNTLEYAASENGYTDTIENTVYTDDSDLPVEVKELINGSETPIFTTLTVETYSTDSSGNTTTTERYYIINITSKDATTFKDEFIDTIVANTDETEFIQSLINKHDVRFHDQESYDYFSSVYDGAK